MTCACELPSLHHLSHALYSVSRSVFGPSGSGNFPVPTPLAGIALHTSLSGVIGVPATPAGTTVVAVSAGYENGCLLYSDTSAGCFGDVGNANAYSNFVGTGGYVTDGSGNVVTGITQIVAAPGQNGGILLLRNDVTSGFAGVVTYLYDIKSPVPGVNSAVDGNFNVIDPLNPSVALQGAILVAQGTDQSCAFMGEQYKQPNAVVCFSFGTHGKPSMLSSARVFVFLRFDPWFVLTTVSDRQREVPGREADTGLWFVQQRPVAHLR